MIRSHIPEGPPAAGWAGANSVSKPHPDSFLPSRGDELSRNAAFTRQNPSELLPAKAGVPTTVSLDLKAN
jgi:hypothetical protein